MIVQPTIQDVQNALKLPDFDGLSAQMKMAPVPRGFYRPPDRPGRARVGGVLVLLYYRDDELHLLLTRRRDDLNSHAGQVSFPGGGHEAPETLPMTALRETREEVGVRPDTLTILGQLTPLYIPPSDFQVYPFVAWYKNGGRPIFKPNRREVAEIIETPLRRLLDPASRAEELWELHGHRMMVPYFSVEGHKVWGATAIMLSEFLERLRAISD